MQVKIDNCKSNPCLNNGTCVEAVNGYVCACPAGYSGASCEVLAALH